MCLMWASWFSLCPVDPFRLPLPDLVRWVGLGMLIMGLGFAIGGAVQLRGLGNIGDDWKKRIWSLATEKITRSIAREHGFDHDPAKQCSPNVSCQLEVIHVGA